MKRMKVQAALIGLLCLGLAGASVRAAEQSIEAQVAGDSQMFDLAVPHMAMGKNQNGPATRTLKDLKNIKASANTLHLAKAQEKGKAAAKCDVTKPGCRESMAVPEYKGTSANCTRRMGFETGFMTIEKPAAKLGDNTIAGGVLLGTILLAPAMAAGIVTTIAGVLGAHGPDGDEIMGRDNPSDSDLDNNIYCGSDEN